jgi:hypothetical protein
MSGTTKRNRLMPWTIGLVVIVLAVIYAGWTLLSSDCAVPAPTVLIALVVMPAVYLVLMYLTLTSQE